MTDQQYKRFTEEPIGNEDKRFHLVGLFMATGLLALYTACIVLLILAMIGVIL